eukprot:scaffold28136_cov62-Isochrysis_galbana.AAC.1
MPVSNLGTALGVGAAVRMVTTAAWEEREMTAIVTTVLRIRGVRKTSTKGSKPPAMANAMASKARHDSFTKEERSSVIWE